MKNKLKLFLSNGFISFDHLLDLKECKKLFNILKKIDAGVKIYLFLKMKTLK